LQEFKNIILQLMQNLESSITFRNDITVVVICELKLNKYAARP